MLRYVGRRLLGAIPVLWGVATLVFVVMRLLPGDPAALMLSEAGGSAEAIAGLRASLGFDDPLIVQYARYLSSLLQGDLGISLFSHRPVVDIIAEQLPSTLALAVAAMMVSAGLGVTMGVMAAARHGTWVDTLITTISAAGVSIPIFWSALLLIWLFSLKLGWLPATGQGSLAHLILPALVLGFASSAVIARLVRASLLDVLEQDYVSTARAKGLRRRVVLMRHALRNALIPVDYRHRPAVRLSPGRYGRDRDDILQAGDRPAHGRRHPVERFPVVQGIVLLAALVYTLVNLSVDVAYAYLDPRIRYD